MERNNFGQKINPRVRDVLKLLAIGVILPAVIFIPGIAAFGPIIKDEQKRQAKKEWERFNLWRLREVIKRLRKQKVVEVSKDMVKITDRGKQKLLKFDLENLKLERKRDGKWRLVIYDISNLRKPQREEFRETLKRLEFFRLQESVYLTPFVCEDEIEYLRQLFGLDREVQVLKIASIEHEEVYRKYFGL